MIISIIQWNPVNATTFRRWKIGRINGMVVLKGSLNKIITHNTRILFHKAHLYKSICFIFTFSHVKKAYTANQNCVQLFHMWKYNQSTVA